MRAGVAANARKVPTRVADDQDGTEQAAGRQRHRQPGEEDNRRQGDRNAQFGQPPETWLAPIGPLVPVVDRDAPSLRLAPTSRSYSDD